MANSTIHDIMDIQISELSTHQLMKVEQKMMQSNKKLPMFIVQNLVKDSRHNHVIGVLKARYENPHMVDGTVSCQKLLLDFLLEFFPGMTINVLIKLCRNCLCHVVAKYLQDMLINFNKDENFPDDKFVDNRFSLNIFHN